MKMEDYLNKMKQISDNLRLAGSPLTLYDLFSQILAGLDSEYTPVVMTLLDKKELTWIQFQTTLLTFESRLEQIHSFQSLSINSASVNSAQVGKTTTSSKENKTKNKWKGTPRGGRGRGRDGNTRPICQVCGKAGHTASI